jgi:hypothetical protein
MDDNVYEIPAAGASSRIVPCVRDIGWWDKKVRDAFDAIGAIAAGDAG